MTEDVPQFEILPGLPGTGPYPEQFPSPGPNYSEGLVVKFFPPGMAPWVGNFRCGSGGCLSGAFVHPNGQYVVVIADGDAYVVEPVSRKEIDSFGGRIQTCEYVSTLNLLVFTNPWFVGKLSSDGAVAYTEQLSYDGLRNLQIDASKLSGEAWHPSDDDWYAFEVDLATLTFKGGSYNRHVLVYVENNECNTSGPARPLLLQRLFRWVKVLRRPFRA